MVKRSTRTLSTNGLPSLRAIARVLMCAAALALAFHTVVHGQLGTPNTPVLPPLPVDPADPNAILKTDLVMQRQVEPEIIASTRNSQHLIAFFNDYRSVVINNDVGIGGSQMARAGAAIKRFFARLLGYPVAPPRPTYIAAAEATTGVAQSSDGGLTWVGGLAPGSFDDTSPAGMASPAHGSQAMTDPRGVAAPCGVAYLFNVAFTRNGESKLLWTKYQDQNLVDGGQTWAFQGQGVIETGFNSPGHFHDLPYAIVDIRRPPTSNPCDHVLYVAWARFAGSASASKIMFARSTDGAQSWTLKYIKSTNKTDQGLVMTVDKRPGLPSQGGGGTLYVGWRVFGPTDPNAMFLTYSKDFGNTFAAARPINGTTLLHAYDQPGLGTNVFPTAPAAHLTFRSNAFMTLESVPHPTDPNKSTLFAGWQERVNLLACGGAQPGPDCGRPSATGDPRIVVTRSTDDGATWLDSLGLPGRRAVDIGDRDNPASPDFPQPGFGYLPIFRASGQQMMPRFSFGAGRFAMGYLEARGPLNSLPPSAGFAGGMSRQTDARLALLDPVTGALLGTNQISRYPVKVGANLANGETAEDIVEHTPGVRAISDRSNAPSSGGGITPFFGDFLGINPIATFVRDRASGLWRHAIRPADAPFRGFHMVFPDSRNVIPPAAPTPDQQALLYQLYDPPGLNAPPCVNPGSRNHDVMHALVDAGVPVNTIAGYKKLGVIARNFPLTFHNVQGTKRFFRASVAPEDLSEASFDQFDPNVDTIDLEILPYSSITHAVTVESTDPLASVTVNVVELALTCSTGTPALDNPACISSIKAGGEFGSVTLNLDPTNGANATATNTETHNPIVTNPIVTNPIVTNPIVTNSHAHNPIVTNPIVTNPIVTNGALADETVYAITDVTWTVTNAGTDATSYLTRVALENFAALRDNYVFHLFIYKVAAAARAEDCTTTAVPQDQIISSIPNPIVTNPIVTNPIVTNPIVTNPIVTNSTFATAPSETGAPGTAAARTALSAAAAAPTYAPDGTMTEVKEDSVRVTLRGYQIVPTGDLTPDTTFKPLETPPAIAVTSTVTNTIDGVVEETPPSAGNGAADLLIEDYTPTPGLTAAVGGEVTLSSFTIRNQGTGNANAAGGEFRSGVYLSLDPAITPDRDIFLGGFDTDNEDLPAGGSTSLDGPTVTIPGVAPGNYYIGIYINDQQTVVEAPLTNNFVSEPITITGGTPVTGLRFVTQPRPVTTNQPALPAVQVEARDETGAVLPGIGITLAFGANPGDANVTGASATTNALGIATFHDLRVDRSASGYTLVASGFGILSPPSTAFNTFGLASPTCTPTPFSTAPVRPMGFLSVSVVAADFDHDGFVDLATANEGPGTVSVRRGAGDGTFDAAPQHYPTLGISPQQLVAADFNRDGWVDLATTNSSSGNVSVLINNAEGGFAGAVLYPTATGDSSPGLAVGDVNGDGRLDLVVLTVSSDTGAPGAVNVLRGNGLGGFSAATEHPAGSSANAVTVADFNGDGRADVAVIHDGDNSSFTDGFAAVLLAGGRTGFLPAVDYPLGSPGTDIVAADIDGDHTFDLVASSSNGVNIVLGQAGGGFGAPQNVPGPQTVKIAVSDFSGDGLADIAATNPGPAETSLLVLIQGAGLAFAPASYQGNVNPYGITAGDWDADGRADIAIANADETASGLTVVANQCGENTLFVTNTNDSGAGSLRQAILDSNAQAGSQLIAFNIPGGGLHTIALVAPLPGITDNATIDATSQPGYDGTPVVVVDGAGAGVAGIGFHVLRTSQIKGFSIVNFNGAGILLDTDLSGGSFLESNFIGVTPAGVDAGNGVGIQLNSSPKNQIGSAAPGGRNVISGNSGQGIAILGGIDFGGTSVQNNLIGTNPAGTAAVPNDGGGMLIQAPISIGGTAANTGNLISGNGTAGIIITGDDHDCIIQGNRIGTNLAGTAALPNVGPGIAINDAEFSTIGGLTAAARNVISGNASWGIVLTGDASATNVQGNYIGTNAAGTAAIGNVLGGVLIDGTFSTQLGGTSAGARNIISGNGGPGVALENQSRGNDILGNYIGTDVTGTVAIGNGQAGVILNTNDVNTNNHIGNATGLGGNVISGNLQQGIRILSDSGATVEGNFIGTNAAGTAALGNGQAGIRIESGPTIVGFPGAGANVISGNAGAGIHVLPAANGSSIISNLIGTSATGLAAIPNAEGIRVDGVSAVGIGGVSPSQANTISGNTGAGVVVIGNNNGLSLNRIGTNIAGTGALPNAAGVAIQGNENFVNGGVVAFNTGVGVVVASGIGNGIATSIHSNGGLGIDLGNDGITANDPQDLDAGANSLQNFPAIASAISLGASTNITGTALGIDGGTVTIRVYATASCDPSGNGEGQRFLGSFSVVLNVDGQGAINQAVGATTAGEVVTATATDHNGSTSEFSACRIVTGG